MTGVKHIVIIFRYVHNRVMAQNDKRQKAKQRKPVGKRRVRGQKVGTLRAAAAKHRPRGTWVEGMETLYKPIKKPVTLRLDADVIAWFQTGGRGYQTRINRALRKLMLQERKG